MPADGTVLRLATAHSNDAGSAFTTAPLNVSAGFSTSFNFRITNPGGDSDSGTNGHAGADGLVFVVQRSGPTALGSSGEGLGYLGIAPSVGVEFDTWQNTNRGDPNSSHVGVDTGGSVTSLATANVVNPWLDNGAKWTAWVDYNGSVLEVRASQNGIRPATALLSQTINVANTIGGNTAYVGFTASTGGAYENHDLLSWVFSDTFLAGGLTLYSWSGSGAWTDTARWNPGAIPGASDVALISAGSANVGDARSLGTLQLSGGDLTGTGTLTLTGMGSIWNGGVLTGTGTLKVASGASLEISGTSAKTFTRNDGNGSGGRTLENLGTISWTGTGSLLAGDGARILNQSGALFDLKSDATLGFTGGGNAPALTNAGTFRKSAGTGTSTVALTGFTTSGLVDVQSGTLSFTSAVTSNGGTFTAAASDAILFSGGQTFNTGTSFTGAGAIRITGGSTTVAGTIAAGGLEFAGGDLSGSATIGGTMAWTAGTWRAADILTFSSGSTLGISGAADKNLVRGDGNGSGGRVLRTAGTVIWSDAGRIVGNDGAGIDVLAGGVFEMRNDASFVFGGGGNVPSLVNAGTVRKIASSGTTLFESVAFTNNGRLELGSGSLSLTGQAGLANNGVVEVVAGTLTSSASGMTSTGGSFGVLSGAQLRYTGGTNTMVNSSFTGAGLTEVAGGTLLVSGSTLAGNFQLSSGAVGGAGTFTVMSGGAFTWSGGALTGTGTLAVATGGSLQISGELAKLFNRGDGNGSGGRIITNAGTTTWSGPGSILGGDGGAFSNLAGGLFDATGDATFGHTGGGNVPTFLNAGTVRKSAGTGVTTFAVPFTNSGGVESKSGTLRFTGGGSGSGQFIANGGVIDFAASYTLNDGARLLGPSLGQLTAGHLTVPAAATATVGGTGAGSFALAGGVLDGAGVFLVDNSGVMTWSGGDVAGVGTLRIAAGGELDVTGNVDHKFFRGDGNGSGGRVIENLGTVRWSGGNLLGGDGAQFTNGVGGLFDLTGGGTFGFTGGGNAPTLVNAGTLRQSSGATSTFSQTSVTNSGLVQVNAGSLIFASPVTSNAGAFFAGPGTTITFSGGQAFNHGTSFTGTGLVQATAGATTLAGTVNAARLVLAGGSLYGTATINGTLEWSGGDLRGADTLTIAPAATLLLTGTGDRVWLRGDGNGSGGRIIENRGAMIVNNSGNLLGNDGAQLVNRLGGTVDLRNDASITHGGSGNVPTFTNEGTLLKSAGTGTSTIAIPFVNTGTIVISSGSLAFTSSFTNTGGGMTLANGASFATTGSLDLGTAKLGGTGTITAANVTAGGEVSPGSSPGQLTLTGNLTLLNTSTTLMEIAGSTQGTQYDFLSVGGTGLLAGNLHLSILNGFEWIMPANSTFTILTAQNGLTGAFANVAPGQRLMTLDGNGSFQVDYLAGSLFSPNSVVLSSYISAVPEPSTYVMLGIGAGYILCSIRRRRR